MQKAMFSLNTYGKDGNLLHQGTGFYVGPDGDAIADYRLFKGAYQAKVTDAAGKTFDVDCILGADDSYSIVRFKVDTKGNSVLSPVAAPQHKGGTVYAVNTESNELKYGIAAVADTSMIKGEYVYYALSSAVDEKLLGGPVFDEKGLLVGIMHSTIADKSYVLDVHFKDTLKISAIMSSSANVALNNIFIPKGLPETAEEALVYLYFKSKSASDAEYIDMTNRFVAAFPQNAEGYMRRATPLIDLQRFDEAEADLQKYLTLVEDKAVGNYNVGSAIFNKLSFQPEPAYDKWTHDVAISYMDKAIEFNRAKNIDEKEKQAHEAQFMIQKALILRGKKDCDAAIAIYEELNKRNKMPSYFYAISLAQEARGDSALACIAPLDSAIAMYSEPLPTEAGEYIIRRGKLLANAGRYRDAVKDYNKYSYLNNSRMNSTFYYERAQIEINARMFQQALDDIDKAIEISPRVPLFHFEKASLFLRVGNYDECIESCNNTIMLNPDIIDAYRLLGYAQLQKGDKEAGRKNLQKAIDMGDENAKVILEKYL
ncbi:MAG: hypothetical protein MJZ41_03680 [Bacteroidaceae bacterium]|nr:hypothetical protein [Bacteroidaceae bacterium]